MTAVEALITPAAGTALEVDLAAIGSDGNVRVDVGDVTGLAASIASEGLQQPLVIYPDGQGGWSLLAGHRRRDALESLGRTTARCIVVDPPADDAARIVAQLVENLQRADLDPREEARAFRLLVDAGLSQRNVAERVGCSQPHVSRRLKLLTLDDEVLDEVLDADVPLDDVVRLASLPESYRDAAVDRWREQRDQPYARSLPDLITSARNRADTAERRTKALEALRADKGADLVVDQAGDLPWASTGWLKRRGVTLDDLAAAGDLRWTVSSVLDRQPLCASPDDYPPVDDDGAAGAELRAAHEAADAAAAELRDAVAAAVLATPRSRTMLFELALDWPGRYQMRRGMKVALGTAGDGIDDDAALVTALRGRVRDDRVGIDVVLKAIELEAALSGSIRNAYRRHESLRSLVDADVDLPAPHAALLALLEAQEVDA